MAWCITQENLKVVCRQHKLFEHRPELNEVLYLHYKGITKLENLEAFSGLKTLYLECNAVQTIENLDHMTELRCLYMANNVLKSLEGIQVLSSLWTLDVSHNALESLASLSCLTSLRSLSATHNKLAQPSGLAALKDCTELQTLDLGNNSITQHDALEVILELPVSLLRLVGNPIVSKTQNYRKRVLLAMPALQNLDDMPCFEKDRRLALAHSRGGIEAERLERKAIAAEAAATRERHRCAFNDLIERARREHAEAQAARQVVSVEIPVEQPAKADVPAPAPPLCVGGEVVEASAGETCGGDAEMQPCSTGRMDLELDAAESSSCTADTAILSGSVSLEPPVLLLDREKDAGSFSGDANVDVQLEEHIQTSVLDGVKGMADLKRKGAENRKNALWNTAGYQELWQLALLAGKEQEGAVGDKAIAEVHSDSAEDDTILAFTEAVHVDAAPA